MNKKLIYSIAAAVLVLAVIVACVLLFRRPPQVEPEPIVVETPAPTPTITPTAAPVIVPEAEPTEQPPTITPPAAYSSGASSGSNIQLWPVLPSSSSDLSPSASPDSSKGA